MKKLHPRCYICGDLTGDWLMLVAMLDEVDRVFITHEGCAKRMDADYQASAKVSP